MPHPTQGPDIPAAVRTDDRHFDNLPDFPFPPHYVDVTNPYDEESLRLHYIDDGAKRRARHTHGAW